MMLDPDIENAAISGRSTNPSGSKTSAFASPRPVRLPSEMTASRAALVRRAMRYPYPTPNASFVMYGGKALPIAHSGGSLGDSLVWQSGRTRYLSDLAPSLDFGASRRAVLAVGSNAAPAQLRRKLAGHEDVLPVIRARLQDFDVVYSAHISGYGAVPATLWQVPGATADVCVTFLTPEQEELMLDTEGGNYHYSTLPGVSLDLEYDLWSETGPVFAFVSKFGALSLHGGPVALGAVVSMRSPLPRCSEPALLRQIARRLGFSTASELVLRVLEDDAERQRVLRALNDEALPSGFPYEPL